MDNDFTDHDSPHADRPATPFATNHAEATPIDAGPPFARSDAEARPARLPRLKPDTAEATLPTPPLPRLRPSPATARVANAASNWLPRFKQPIAETADAGPTANADADRYPPAESKPTNLTTPTTTLAAARAADAESTWPDQAAGGLVGHDAEEGEPARWDRDDPELVERSRRGFPGAAEAADKEGADALSLEDAESLERSRGGFPGAGTAPEAQPEIAAAVDARELAQNILRVLSGKSDLDSADRAVLRLSQEFLTALDAAPAAADLRTQDQQGEAADASQPEPVEPTPVQNPIKNAKFVRHMKARSDARKLKLLEHELDQMSPPSKARTRKTELKYLEMVNWFIGRATRKRMPDADAHVIVGPNDLVDDLLDSQSRHKFGTAMSYRSALVWYLAVMRRVSPEHETAYQRLAGAPKPVKPRTKRAPPRTIPEEDFRAVIAELAVMNGSVGWGTRTQYWMHAGLASGARPKEWLGACWADDAKEKLCLPNAKRKIAARRGLSLPQGKTVHDLEHESPEQFSVGPLLDPSKAMRIVPIEKDERGWVDVHMSALGRYIDESTGKTPEEAYINYFNVCREVLNKACHRAFKGKKLYSLYVMRSQFAANMKAEMPLEDVADLLGNQPRIARSNYGRRKNAHGGRGAERPVETNTDMKPQGQPRAKNAPKNRG